MFGLSKSAIFAILCFTALGIFGLLFYSFSEAGPDLPVRTPTEEAAYCAMSKMTVKMKRARAIAEHQYVMGTIKGKAVKYTNPSEDHTFISLVKSCLPETASKQAQVDATNRLGVMLAYDEEYRRLMAPMEREQDRARRKRR